jgi:predicted Zn-dependent protease
MSLARLRGALFSSSLSAALLLLVVGCATSPTGRNQLLIYSELEMANMGQTAFAEIQKETPVSTSTRDSAYVRCVATAITSVLTPQERASISVDQWVVDLFEDPTANAFALPGGRIGVNTGLLPVAKTPAQLATVLGHEVSHVLAHHGNERVSQSSLAQTGMQAVQVLVGADTQAKQDLLGALGLGVQYGVLMPFSRTQESEADEMGLELMARAGFDPRESINLWRNMESMSAGQAPPEFMSTHPSHSTRIERLSEKLPAAIVIYDSAVAAGHKPNCRR